MASFSGSGESPDDPIVISGVEGHFQAIDAEYQYLAQRFGQRRRDWRLIQQALVTVDGKAMDRMDIQLADGTTLTLFFDISAYFGQF